MSHLGDPSFCRVCASLAIAPVTREEAPAAPASHCSCFANPAPTAPPALPLLLMAFLPNCCTHCYCCSPTISAAAHDGTVASPCPAHAPAAHMVPYCPCLPVPLLLVPPVDLATGAHSTLGATAPTAAAPAELCSLALNKAPPLPLHTL